MNTLTTAPLASLLTQLFKDAEATSAVLHQQSSTLSPQARATMLNASDYRALYASMKDFHIAVSPETGQLLYMLARSSGAKSIVEFGTSFGISTLHLAAALKDNGGGKLISTEFEPSKAARAHGYFATAGLADLIEVREGDALETLARDLPESIDLVLLDGAKPLYMKVLALIESRLRPGALIVADNADRCPEYVAHVRAKDKGYLSVPFAEDVELSMRLG